MNTNNKVALKTGGKIRRSNWPTRLALCILLVIVGSLSAYALYDYCWYTAPSIVDKCASFDPSCERRYYYVGQTLVDPPQWCSYSVGDRCNDESSINGTTVVQKFYCTDSHCDLNRPNGGPIGPSPTSISRKSGDGCYE